MQGYNIVDISCSFNKSIKQIINCIDMTINNNIMFDTMKRRIKIIIDTNPLLLLQEGGPYIFEYRDYIKNDKFDDLFLNTENILKDTIKNDIKECSWK